MDRALEFALEEDSDLYFYQMMHRMNSMEAEKFESEAAAIPPTDQLQKSYAHFLKKFTDINRKDRQRQWLSKTQNVVQRAAVFLLVFFIAGSCAVLQVDAIREQLGRWLVDWNSHSVDIGNDINSCDDTALYEIDHLSFAFGWLPAGCYLLDRSVKDDGGKVQKYCFQIYREDLLVGEIEMLKRTVRLSLDNENAVTEYLDIEGYQQALYLEKKYTLPQQMTSYRALLAQNSGCIVYISNKGAEDGLAKDDLVQILEQINFISL